MGQQEQELDRKQILDLLSELSDRLQKREMVGEIILFGGAVMTVVLEARRATKDVDAIFDPPRIIREVASEIAMEHGLSEDWLNDGVKGFVSDHGEHALYYEDEGLRIFAAAPEYLLAMKCTAMRLGETKDEQDIRFLLDHLELQAEEDVFEVVEKYYPADRIPPRTKFAIQEMMGGLTE